VADSGPGSPSPVGPDASPFGPPEGAVAAGAAGATAAAEPSAGDEPGAALRLPREDGSSWPSGPAPAVPGTCPLSASGPAAGAGAEPAGSPRSRTLEGLDGSCAGEAAARATEAVSAGADERAGSAGSRTSEEPVGPGGTGSPAARAGPGRGESSAITAELVDGSVTCELFVGLDTLCGCEGLCGVAERGVTRTRAGLPIWPNVEGTGSVRTSTSTWSERRPS
jgi:hypothetical protein